MIRACIFDLDGTLCDSIGSIGNCVNHVLEEFGHPAIAMECFKTFVGDGVHRLMVRVTEYLQLPASMTEPLLSRYMERFRLECTEGVRPYRGIPELLIELKKRGIAAAVLSNKPHPNTCTVIHTVFGEGVFDVVRGQQEGIPRKPNPAGALLEAELLKVKPEECLYIGDTGIDMDTGNAAGMETVGVLWGFRDEAELRQHRAAHIIAEPWELTALLDKGDEERHEH